MYTHTTLLFPPGSQKQNFFLFNTHLSVGFFGVEHSSLPKVLSSASKIPREQAETSPWASCLPGFLHN